MSYTRIKLVKQMRAFRQDKTLKKLMNSKQRTYKKKISKSDIEMKYLV